MKAPYKLKKLQSIGLTQQKLAYKLGVSLQTVHAWISGKSTPRAKHIEQIEALYAESFGAETINSIALKEKERGILKILDKNLSKNILKNKEVLDALTLKITHNTNTIEGSTLTEHDTADILFKQKVLANHTLTEHLEASNHAKAFKIALRLAEQKQVSVENILDLHRVLMAGILDNAGALRNHQVRILGSHVPIANYMKLHELLEEFVIEYNKKPDNVFAHIAKMHAGFEQIHPFSDGNGRIGRLLMVITALRYGLPPVLVLKDKKYAYYKYLQKAQLEQKYDLLEDFVCDAMIEGARSIGI